MPNSGQNVKILNVNVSPNDTLCFWMIYFNEFIQIIQLLMYASCRLLFVKLHYCIDVSVSRLVHSGYLYVCGGMVIVVAIAMCVPLCEQIYVHSAYVSMLV